MTAKATSGAQSAQAAALEALIEAHATELKLPTVKRRFRGLAQEAAREQQTPTAYLAALLAAETAEHAERRERRRLFDARFPALKRLEDFRFTDNPKIPQATIATLAEGSWISDRESVILIGDSGTGKTHLATALAICACQQGRRVRFSTLAALANELQEAQSRTRPASNLASRARSPITPAAFWADGASPGELLKVPAGPNVPTRTLQEWMGHKDIATCSDRTSQLISGASLAVDVLDGLLDLRYGVLYVAFDGVVGAAGGKCAGERGHDGEEGQA